MNFDQTPEFKRDLKKLQKKWRSLASDISDAQLIISDVYTDTENQALYQQKFFDGKRATRLQTPAGKEVVKMRLDVATLATNSKARLIFIAIVEHEQILLVELYSKSDKSREDKTRIKKYL